MARMNGRVIEAADPGDSYAQGMVRLGWIRSEHSAVPTVPIKTRRTGRDWIADAVLFVFAIAVWFVEWSSYPPYYTGAVESWMLVIDPVLGLLGCALLWWRRRFPLAVALVLFVVLAIAGTAMGATLVAVFTLAIYRGWLASMLVTALYLAMTLTFAIQNPPPGSPPWLFGVTIGLMYLVPLGWGIAIRARRQVIEGLRRDAESERLEYRRRLADARRAERERIAREMHDVLAHRISLISVHAGALAYRTAQAESGTKQPMDAADVRQAIDVIDDNARHALTELGEVLNVLRADDDGSDPLTSDVDSPQPRLTDLARLVSEARDAGQQVTMKLECAPGAADILRPALQRSVYRTVQEGLTNARKHARNAPVSVRVQASPEDGVIATITSPVLATQTVTTVPGAGMGLTGLAERVALEGGTVEHGVSDGHFRLSARLPWLA